MANTLRRIALPCVRAFAAVASVVLLAAPVAPGAGYRRDTRAWLGGVAVVGYRSEAALRDALRRHPGQVLRRLPALRVAEIRPRGDLARFAQGVERTPGIAYVERRALRGSTADPAVLPSPLPGGAYEWQWAATRAHLVPDSVLRAAGAFTIAVIDTGADVAAPDLAAKAPVTYSLGGSTDVPDASGHGTFVAALAAGSVTNSEGMAGFGGDAKLMVVQATAAVDGNFTDIDEARAIVWAVDRGARIINLSLAGTETSSTEKAAVDYAVSRGVLLVAAVGNEYGAGNPVEYPAALLQPVGSNGKGGVGLAVGASTLSGARADFSNTGSYISLVAPGDEVFSALPSAYATGSFLAVPLPGSRAGVYGYGSGTSFAAPQAAGAAALVWAANPALTAQEVATILEETASGKGAWNDQLGYGVLDVAAAVERAGALVRPSVQLAGERLAGGRLALRWTGTGAVAYRVAVRQDGGPERILLPSTRKTSEVFDLTFGHRYDFVVAALDASGAEAARSNAFTLSLPRVSSTLRLSASRTGGRSPLRVRLAAKLSPRVAGVPSGERTVVLDALEGGSWSETARGVTSRSGTVRWSFTLEPGVYRLRARFGGTHDLEAARSRTLVIRVS